VLANVEKINRAKQRYRSPFPYLTWQFLVFGHNEHQIAAARARAEALHMQFSVGLPTNLYSKSTSFECEFSPVRDRALVRQELGYATLAEFGQVAGVSRDHGVCTQLWDRPAINWDGAVLGCCVATHAFGGNAFRDGLMSSVNSDAIRHARQMVSGQAPPREDVVCSSCPVYRLMRQDGTWVKFSRKGILQRGRSLLQRELPGAYRAAARLRDRLRALKNGPGGFGQASDKP
jgi:hypothetical protein